MKNLVVLLLVSLVATCAMATVNPDPDEIGFYMDESADTNAMMYETTQSVYVIVNNPTGATVDGVEFGYVIDVYALDPDGNRVGRVDDAVIREIGRIDGADIGVRSDNLDFGDVIFGFGAPQAPDANGNVIVFEFTVRLFDDLMVDFYLSPPSVGGLAAPRYVSGGDTLIDVGYTTEEPLAPIEGFDGLEGVWVASVNNPDDMPVAVETSSFGSVKSLFR